MNKTLGLMGKKVGMTRIFADDGSVIPVTVIKAGPCPIIQSKSVERDGYTALQVGFDKVESHRVTKPQRGHQSKVDKGFFRHLCEIRLNSLEGFEPGQELNVSMFAAGERVKVVGTSKGHGFTGVMKRWNFSGMPASHGHEKNHRAPGSIGQCADPSRVAKGKKMAGQMGDARVTCGNAEIVDVRPEDNLILVRGQIPGAKNGLVMIRKQS